MKPEFKFCFFVLVAAFSTVPTAANSITMMETGPINTTISLKEEGREDNGLKVVTSLTEAWNAFQKFTTQEIKQDTKEAVTPELNQLINKTEIIDQKLNKMAEKLSEISDNTKQLSDISGGIQQLVKLLTNRTVQTRSIFQARTNEISKVD